MPKRIFSVLLLAGLIAAALSAQDALVVNADNTISIMVNGQLKTLQDYLVPVGTIQAYAFQQGIPQGWLACDGQAVSKLDHPEYAALVEALRAEANGNTSHPYYHPNANMAYLPDLRGRFPRGLDKGTNRDPGAAVSPANPDDARKNAAGVTVGDVAGGAQGDAFQAWQLGAEADDDGPRGYWGRAGSRNYSIPGQLLSGYTNMQMDIAAQGLERRLKPVSDGVNGTPRTSSESRPENVAVNFIIKY